MIASKPDLTAPQDDAVRTAADWLVRLEGGALDPVTRAQFEVWLADPAHAAALAEAREVWRQAEALRPQRDELLRRVLPGVNPEHAAKKWIPVFRIKHATTKDAGPRYVSFQTQRGLSGPFGTRWRAPVAMAASLLLAVGGVALYGQATTPDLRTAPGEVRTFTLSDGSRLTLDGHSAADIAFDDKVRRIDLRAGAAYVVAAPRQGAETRPLVVRAQGGEAQALGTQFAVERLAATVRVTVTEHRVEVRNGDGRAVVDAGQSVTYGPEGWQAAWATPIAQAAMWRERRLLFDRVPLRDVVAELNRHRAQPIRILGRKLADRRVSGVFNTNSPEATLQSVMTGLKAQKVNTPMGPVLYSD